MKKEILDPHQDLIDRIDDMIDFVKTLRITLGIVGVFGSISTLFIFYGVI